MISSNNNSSFYNSTSLVEIDLNILSQVNDFESLRNCETVSKLWNKLIKKFENYETAKEKYFVKKLMPKIDLFPIGLVEALGGIKKICALPILSLTYERQSGKYIDWLAPEDLVGHNIWRGEDKYERPFITFSFKQFGIFPFTLGNGVRTIHKYDGNDTDLANNAWIGAGNKTRDYDYPYLSGNKMHSVFDRLKELFSNGKEVQGSTLTILGASAILPLEYNVFSHTR